MNESWLNEIFYYTKNPGYFDMVYGVYKSVKWYYSPYMMRDYSIPGDLYNDLVRCVDFPFNELIIPIVYIAIFFTLTRYAFEHFICKKWVKYLNFNLKSDAEKFPESVWKCLVYTFMWSYLFYLLILSNKYEYFTDQEEAWNHWNYKMEVPFDTKLIYLIECGFYLHSIYATIYMDAKRRDYHLMLLHHFVTLSLLVLSYSLRYHRFGLLTLFFHDINDILLEYTKCNVYMRYRNNRFYRYHERLTEIGFSAFLASWALSRLYWFPLKVIYQISVTSHAKAHYIGATFFFPFLFLLNVLLVLNVYWFYLISLIVIKKLIGQMDDSCDIREDEINRENSKKLK